MSEFDCTTRYSNNIYCTDLHFERGLRQRHPVEGVGHVVHDGETQRQADPQHVEHEVEQDEQATLDSGGRERERESKEGVK